MTRRAAVLVIVAGCVRGPNLDAIVRPYLDAHTVAGLSIAIERHGQLVVERGYGQADLENDVPARPDTVYAIGPITKEFTAVAVLQLVGAGRISLDDDVHKFLPDFPPTARKVTIHHLLSHTSGLKDFEYDEWWRTKSVERTPEEMLALWRSMPILFPAGEGFTYSSTGYGLLGVIVEKASGQSFEAYLRDHVIRPAGLEHTEVCSPRGILPKRADGYTVIGGKLAHADLVLLDQYGGAGALCSTLDDLLLWERARDRLISRALRERMHTPGTLADGTRTWYGYGLIIATYLGHRFIGHQGGVPGFTAVLYHYVDDDLTIAVLANTDSVAAIKIEREVASALLHLPPPEFKAAETPLPPRELAGVVGEYALRAPGERPIVVAEKDGRVVVDGRSLRHVGAWTFVDRNGQVLRFGQVTGGKARALELDFFGIRLEARRSE